MQMTLGFLGTSLALVLGLGGTPDLDAGERAAIEAVVTEEMARHAIPGLAMGIRREGHWVVQAGYGLARLKPPSPVTARTRFQIASLTKPICACVVLRQVEARRLHLDEPVRRRLDWLPESYADVTVRDLLQHVSGVPRDLRADNLDDFDAAEFRARLEQAEPAFARGTRFQYSNTGYILLGLVVEQAAGRPFDQVLTEALVEPLGLTSTVYLQPPSEDLLQAEGTEPGDTCFVAAPYYSGGFSAGGISTNIEDLARWLDALDQPDFLPAGAKHAMHSPGQLASGEPIRLRFADDPDASYGMGWFLTRRGERVLWTHGGAVSGFSSAIDRYPDDDLAVIVLINSKGPGAGAVAQRVAELLLERR